MTLLLPVTSDATVEIIRSTLEVLVRTTPKDVDARVGLLTSPTLAPGVRELLDALDGDLAVWPSPQLRSTEEIPGVVGAYLDAADRIDTVYAVALDPGSRPDLSDLSERIRWFSQEPAAPCSHRPGALLTATATLRDALARARSVGGANPDVATATVGLASRLTDALSARLSSVPAPAPLTAAPATKPTSVVIIADGPPASLQLVVASARQNSPGAEIIVVDPGGDRERARLLASARGIRVITVPAGERHPANAGILASQGHVVVLLDGRAMVTRRWLVPLLSALSEPGVLAVGPGLTVDAGHQFTALGSYSTMDSYVTLAEAHRRARRGETRPVPALDGRCFVARREDLLAAGGLDPAIDRSDLAILDLQLRLQARSPGPVGFVVVDEVVVHVSGAPDADQQGRWRLGAAGLAVLRARHGEDADRRLPGLLAGTMIVKDEQVRLGRCLESVSGVIDDLVVCDTGSSDDTVVLARALGARVTTFGWCDDFSAARNAALQDHVGAWALQVDADDQVVCADVPALRQQLNGLRLDAVQVVYRTFTSDERSTGGSIDVLYERLFRPDRCHYVGRLHEQVRRRDDGSTGSQARSELLHFLHDGHREAVWQGKRDRNARINGLESGSAPDAAAPTAGGSAATDEPAGYGDDSSWRVPFEAARIAPDRQSADDLYATALANMPVTAAWARPRALTARATFAAANGEHVRARDFAAEALQITPGEALASLQFALASEALGEREAACRALREVVPDVGTSVVVVDHRVAQVYVPTTLAGLLLAGDDPAEHREAADLLERVGTDYPDIFDSYDVLLGALRRVDQDRWAERFAAVLGQAGAKPTRLKALLDQLPDDERARLCGALADAGIDPNLAATSVAWTQIEPQLRTLGRSDVTAIAAKTEATDPALALRLWEYVDARADSALGRARCLVALQQPGDAARALAGVNPAALGACDLVFVAVLAAGLGDRATASGLLDRLEVSAEPIPPDVSLTAQELRAALAA